MNTLSKTYVRPFSFVGIREGKRLNKKKEALSIGGGSRYFKNIEIINRNKCSEYLSVKEFLGSAEKNEGYKQSLKKITEKRYLFSNKNFFFKKNYCIFGILNVTPDSFSDGGDFFSLDAAITKSIKMYHDGADYIDIGGESTRPGANLVKDSDEILRVLPIIQRVNNEGINISLDTRNSSTMKLGILSGVKIINDVSALKNDNESIKVIKQYNTPLILMHMPGTPKNMLGKKYKNVVLDIYDFLEERIDYCVENGIKRKNIIVDPGIGFGKDSTQNLQILKNISIFHSLGCPIMLGVSRKRFISSIVNEVEPKKRFPGSIAVAINSFTQGVQIFRVHDVRETKQALEIIDRLEKE
ncbi:dihydropteroate synthase [Rickettsiales bacterium]|nr:dihydropteroate synthase [Rickettsiales bacterium]